VAVAAVVVALVAVPVLAGAAPPAVLLRQGLLLLRVPLRLVVKVRAKFRLKWLRLKLEAGEAAVAVAVVVGKVDLLSLRLVLPDEEAFWSHGIP
jgi:hypothetical protein